jgi:hypothetical protein
LFHWTFSRVCGSGIEVVVKSSKLRVAVLVLAALGAGWLALDPGPGLGGEAGKVAPLQTGVEDAALAAFKSHAQARTITVTGIVERILADDRDRSPHQRFIIRTPGGVSLLVAHNLDLAPRLEGLAKGDALNLLGEYVWNEQGGVMHWTHDDPQGRHAAGYIEWHGRRYQ